jgi:UDP-glucose 4,6-dehydratase
MDTPYTPRSVLVTGGAGFIASNFLNYMVPKYPQVKFVNLDRLDYCASLKNVTVAEAGNYEFVHGDVGSEDLVRYVLLEEKIDTVIHFAAQSHVCNSFASSLQYTRDNVLATHVLLEEVRKYGKVGRFIHVSTDEVYGEIETGTCTEQSLLLPTNPYAASKAAAEFIVRAYQISHKLPIIITRSNNIWGVAQNFEKLIPKFIMHLLHNEKCTIHGNGLTRRNFLHVSDVVRAFETILLKGEVSKIYNIGTDCEYSVLEIAELLRLRICPAKPFEKIVETVPDRLFNDVRYSVDSSSLRALGWKEEVDFLAELEPVIEWYRKYGDTQWLRE